MLDHADHPEEKSYSDIHVVGTNEIPDKAKGSAWSYGLKYYLLNKFNIVQAGADDPDMRGTIDGKPKEERENVTKEKEPKQSPMQGPENNTVKSEKRQKEAKKLAEHPRNLNQILWLLRKTGLPILVQPQRQFVLAMP